MRARNRPPRLEPRVGHQQEAAPPTLEEQLVRSRVAGLSATLGPSELRRLVERASDVHVDRGSLAAAWTVVGEVFGATPADPRIDPATTIAAAQRAVDRIVEVARSGARVALATARPASLLSVHLALANLARRAGADVADGEDSSPMRLDGRTGRFLRWLDGVAAVSDGESLRATHGTEAAQEWLFMVPRPALVVADGSYADVALDAGVEVIALAGLDHCSLVLERRAAAEGSVAAERSGERDRRCLVVPMWTDRSPAAYRPLVDGCLAGLGQRAGTPEV